jgi:hypothetical protein
MSYAYNFCNNCGKLGHAFHQCKKPITSIGTIVFRRSENPDAFKYLLIYARQISVTRQKIYSEYN